MKVFFLLTILCGVSLGAAEVKYVKDWAIRLKIDVDGKPADASLDKVGWRLCRIGKKSIRPILGPFLINSTNDGVYTISPKELGNISERLQTGQYVIGGYWDGRLGKSIPFNIENEPSAVDGIAISFGAEHSNMLSVRVVDAATEKSIPNMEIEFFLSEGSFNDPAYRDLRVGIYRTNEFGIVRMSHLPVGSIRLNAKGGSRYSVAKPNGRFLEALPVFETLPSTGEQIPEIEKLPVLLFLPETAFALYWDTLETVEGKRVSEGTVVEFSAKRWPLGMDEPRPEWDSRKRFQVTVGKEGLVKTPLVPGGIYAVKTLQGDALKKSEVSIDGLGSIHMGSMNTSLKLRGE